MERSVQRIFLFAALSAIAVILIITTNALKKTEIKRHHIAVLNYSPAAEPALKGLKKGLTELGLTEGKDIRFTYKGSISDKTKLTKEAANIVSMKPDIIYTMSTTATLAAKEAAEGTGIPIVFGPVSSPLEAGIVSSLQNQPELITGVTFGPQEGKRFQTLFKIKPDIKNVLIPYNPKDKSPLLNLERLRRSAAQMGVNLLELPITQRELIEEALYRFEEEFDAIFVPTDPLMVANNSKIAKFALLKRVPYTCPQKEGVYEDGVLFSFGFSIYDLGFQAARLVSMLIKGIPVSDIPVEFSEFRLSLNLSTAEKIGIKIPEYLMINSLIIRR